MSDAADLRRALICIRDAWDADHLPAEFLGLAIERARPVIERTAPNRITNGHAAARFQRLADAIVQAWLVDERDVNPDNVRRAFVGVAYRARMDDDTDTALRARAIYTAMEDLPWTTDIFVRSPRS